MRIWRHRFIAFNGISSIFAIAFVAMAVAINAPSTPTQAYSADAFVMEIDTTKVSEYNTTFVVPTVGGDYNYTVDCDSDGPLEPAAGVGGDYTCWYDTPGIYTVSITGAFPQIQFQKWFTSPVHYTDNAKQLTDIKQWGSIEWHSMEDAFRRANNVQVSASDAPDLSRVESMDSMFNGAHLLNDDLSHWDTSNVTSMNSLFLGASSFNQSLDSWDVSNVTDMSYMFAYAESFNQPLNSWDVSSVVAMTGMFGHLIGSSSFNQPLDNWDVGNVMDMTIMFSRNFALSIENYERTLAGWSQRSVQPNVTLGVHGLVYCDYASRDDLVASPHNWNIEGDYQCDNLPVPSIDTSRPNQPPYSPPANGLLTFNIEGSNLALTTGVTIGGIEADIISVGENEVRARISAAAIQEPGAYNITVTNRYGKSGTSYGAYYILGNNLWARNMSSSSAYADGKTREYEILGGYFGSSPVEEVWFGDTRATIVDSSDYSLRVTLTSPQSISDTTAVDVVIENAAGETFTLHEGFTHKALPERAVRGHSFSDDSSKRIMTVNGVGFFADDEDMMNSLSDAISYGTPLVNINGEDIKICTENTPYDEVDESFFEENEMEHFSKVAPCYYLLAAPDDGSEALDLLFGQFRIWLPSDFDITAPGTVSINGSPVYTFNADTVPEPTKSSQHLAPVTPETTTIAAPLRTATLGVSNSDEYQGCANIDATSTRLLAPNTVTAPSGTTILGGVAFELECDAEGDSVMVSLQLGQEYEDTSVLSAYKDYASDGSLTPVDVTFVNRDGATFVEFPLTDGLTDTATGLIDEDGVADGRIVDPLYIGVASSGTVAPVIPGGGPGAGSGADIRAQMERLLPGAPNSGFGQVTERLKSVSVGVYVATLVGVIVSFSVVVIALHMKRSVR